MFKINRETVNYAIAFVLILLGLAMRIVPHPPNVAPITAIALFGGAVFGARSAIIIPLVTMLLSDLIIGTHDTMLFTWGAFLLIAGISYSYLRNNIKTIRLLGITVTSSFLFYVITNFGVWLQGTMYPMTLAGLAQSYFMGIPFYRNTLLGDLFFTASLFATYHLVLLLTHTSWVQNLLPFTIKNND